jgi:hypothetical protein
MTAQIGGDWIMPCIEYEAALLGVVSILYDFFTCMFGPGKTILVCIMILLAISLASFKLCVTCA